jgi:hypothetical protein
MILCPTCTVWTYPDRDACHQCGARLSGPMEPQPRYWLELVTGPFEVNYGRYVAETQKPTYQPWFLTQTVGGASVTLRFDGHNPPVDAHGAPFAYAVDVLRADGGSTLTRHTTRASAYRRYSDEAAALRDAHRQAVAAIDDLLLPAWGAWVSELDARRAA